MTDARTHSPGQSESDRDTAGTWLPTAEAALRLGLTERTLRRHITSGRYRGRREGHAWLAWIPDIPDTLQDPIGHVSRPFSQLPGQSDTIGDASGLLARTVSALEQTVLAERARANEERARSTELEEKLRQAEQVAAMHQERSRNLEEETKRLRAQLALPPTQPETVLATDPVEELRGKVDELTRQLQAQPDAVIPRPWWQWWRRM